ncbi:MAG: M28 family peptidase [Gemmatimonadaceae bacterium]|nr:M28 family peptidase [Gemmatimonadaceae bacterium]
MLRTRIVAASARLLPLLLAPLISAPAQGPALASPSASIFAKVAPRYSGARAKETVAFLDQFARWPGNRGFEASIDHLAQRLERAGYVREDRATPTSRLTYRVERYPMATPAWEATAATVTIAGQREPVLRLSTNRNMLATNSWSTPDSGVVAELVDVGRGTPQALDSAHIAGKIVLADASAGRLFGEAVLKRGAIGVLGYAMPAYTQPQKNTHSIQFGGIPYDTTRRAWAMALSYDAREKLRAALAAGPVRLRVRTRVTWTPNATERTVVAELRGRTRPDERFVYSAHVQEPGANDNASGVGAQMEMARVAAELLKARAIDPARTLTFLWGLEIRSTERYITQDTTRAAGIKWGLSLDMVGEDTKKTGGTFLIEKMPDPSAIWTRGEDKHTEWGGSALTKAQMTPHYFNDLVLGRCLEMAATNGWVVKTNPYEGGSDHIPFIRARKPGLLFWHFTDQFYHTDGDRIDMVSADELRNVGVSALVSGLLLAGADGAAARGIVAEVERAALARLAAERALSLQALTAGGDAARERDILETWGAWYDGALAATADIAVGGSDGATQGAIDAARARVRQALGAHLAALAAR